MDEQESNRLLVLLATRLSVEREAGLRREGYVMETPQSGERIWGRENMRAFQKAFPDHGGRTLHSAAILELEERKIWRDTRHSAEPFEASELTARPVERKEPQGAHR